MRIRGFDKYVKQMRTIHPVMHDDGNLHHTDVTWFDGCRTYNHFRASTALNWLAFYVRSKQERRCAHILKSKNMGDFSVGGDLTKIKGILLEDDL